MRVGGGSRFPGKGPELFPRKRLPLGFFPGNSLHHKVADAFELPVKAEARRSLQFRDQRHAMLINHALQSRRKLKPDARSLPDGEPPDIGERH